MGYRTIEEVGKKQESEDVSSLPELINIESEEQKYSLLVQNSIVVVDVWANWCAPCVESKPHFRKLAAQYNNPGKVLLCCEDVDLELSPDVTGVPTFLFYMKGNLVHTEIGADLVKIESTLKQLIQQLGLL